MNKKVAIQGVKGSNHYLVVNKYLQAPQEIKCYESFTALVDSVVKGESDYGIMAIENSIAGSILPNYNLISQHELSISAEYFLDIKHNLVALQGQRMHEITTVKSHQMAFYQCGCFFEDYPHLKLIEDTDTALPAKQIADAQLANTAAIVPDGTAELYGLDVLQHHIQDHDLNSTRFVKISRKKSAENQNANKASVRFELAHESGSLHRVLSILNEHHINMTKIQSIPTQHSKWNYAFFIDLIFDKDVDIFKIMELIQSKSYHFQILGIYKQGKHD